MFKNTFKGKKVLLTGNTGFKGSWLTLWLLELGAHVYGISKDIPTNPSLFKSLDLEKKLIELSQNPNDGAAIFSYKVNKRIEPTYNLYEFDE